MGSGRGGTPLRTVPISHPELGKTLVRVWTVTRTVVSVRV